MTSATPNASARSASDQRSGRPARNLRATRMPTPVRHKALISVSCKGGGLGGVRVLGDLEQVEGTEVAEGHANQLEPDRRDIRRDRSQRSKRPRRRPLGKARNTCRKRTGGRRSSACPKVKTTSLVDHARLARKLANPAACSAEGPKRLAGRCHQAMSPQRMYEVVTQTDRRR